MSDYEGFAISPQHEQNIRNLIERFSERPYPDSTFNDSINVNECVFVKREHNQLNDDPLVYAGTIVQPIAEDLSVEEYEASAVGIWELNGSALNEGTYYLCLPVGEWTNDANVTTPLYVTYLTGGGSGCDGFTGDIPVGTCLGNTYHESMMTFDNGCLTNYDDGTGRNNPSIVSFTGSIFSDMYISNLDEDSLIRLGLKVHDELGKHI